MAKKISDSRILSKSSRTERMFIKSPYTVKCFLNESFVKNFVESDDVLSKLNLSDYETLRRCEIVPLKIRHMKAIIEFKLHLYDKRRSQQRQPSSSKSIIAKWIHGGQGKQIFDLQQELWYTKGFGTVIDNKNSENHLKICEPIGYSPNHNLMLTSKASGVRLKEILIKDKGYDKGGSLQIYVRRSARWLAKFHSSRVSTTSNSTKPTYLNIRSMQIEKKKLNDWCRHLGKLYPDFAPRIQYILSCITRLEKSVQPKRYALIHGGFHPGNIFVGETDLTVIDFDRSCLFYPAVDLSYFISKLLTIKRKYHLHLLDTKVLEKCFLDEYTVKMSKEPLDGLNIFMARSYLEHIHSRYCQHKHSIDRTSYERHKPNMIDFEYWTAKAEEFLYGHTGWHT